MAAGDGERCRPVTLDSGETVPVLGDRPLSAQDTAAVAALVKAAQRRFEAENPPDEGAPELWRRIADTCNRELLFVRQAAGLAGVKHSVLSRLANGMMPGAEDLALITAWLADREAR